MKPDAEQLAAVIEQERELVFDCIDAQTVSTIARSIADTLRAKRAPSFVLAVVNGNEIYGESLPGATPDNREWARRKGNTATLLSKSSYRVTLEMRMKGKDLSNRGVPVSEYALSGGAFPIKVHDLVVGYFATSGTTQEEEHQLLADAIARHLGKQIPTIFEKEAL